MSLSKMAMRRIKPLGIYLWHEKIHGTFCPMFQEVNSAQPSLPLFFRDWSFLLFFLRPLFVYIFFSAPIYLVQYLLLIKFEEEILSVKEKYRTGITFSASLCTFWLTIILCRLVWLQSTLTRILSLTLSASPTHLQMSLDLTGPYAYSWLVCLSLLTLFLRSLLYLALFPTLRQQPQTEQKW